MAILRHPFTDDCDHFGRHARNAELRVLLQIFDNIRRQSHGRLWTWCPVHYSELLRAVRRISSICRQSIARANHGGLTGDEHYPGCMCQQIEPTPPARSPRRAGFLILAAAAKMPKGPAEAGPLFLVEEFSVSSRRQLARRRAQRWSREARGHPMTPVRALDNTALAGEAIGGEGACRDYPPFQIAASGGHSINAQVVLVNFGQATPFGPIGHHGTGPSLQAWRRDLC